ncbi:GSCFA domain protein [Sphingobacteriaceae bacterium]|nr:GSCFA domain protein [Sphingobacteriaceae bacterium]
MNFHLNFTPGTSDFKINHKQSLLFAGSCFSENIGTYLKDAKFKVVINPNGILFNPLSIYKCIQDAIQNKKADDSSILEKENLFYSYSHHSSFYAQTKKELLQKIDAVTSQTHYFLKTADVLLITFGSGFFYKHLTLHQIVANCHKQPGHAFEKKLAEVDEVVNLYSSLINELKIFNPKLKIIFTVSPVKHLKDGIIENNLSKATLLLSVNKLLKLYPGCVYFPAFELVNDDLRDYRFYKEDLAHPNQQAINYVWEKFSECYFDATTKELNHEIGKINSALNHKQLHENSSETEKLKAFIEKQKNLIKKLDPGIEF